VFAEENMLISTENTTNKAEGERKKERKRERERHKERREKERERERERCNQMHIQTNTHNSRTFETKEKTEEICSFCSQMNEQRCISRTQFS
jgi:hypothetical protein